MRIFVRHATTYCYDRPARSVNQILRMTPRPHVGQHILDWRIDTDIDCRMKVTEDSFGNLVHSFTANGTFEAYTILVEGQVIIDDRTGFIQGAIERMRPALYLRETELTACDAAIRDFARKMSDGREPLTTLHEMNNYLFTHMAFDTEATGTTTTAPQAFAAHHGVCQDFAHVLIAAARALGIPARYVSGYMVHEDDSVVHEAGHAWMEALIPDYGWIAFDPANGVSPTYRHVRVATGLDYLSAAPARGVQRGGSSERMDVSVLTQDCDGAALGMRQSQDQHPLS
ncbi:MAG: transglutaminase family protein [Pseudomonadota bacterium]